MTRHRDREEPIVGARDLEADVDSELAFHLEMRMQKLRAAGMSPDAARREAERQFGDVTGVRHSCVAIDRTRERTTKRIGLFRDFGQDIVFAVRVLRRNAGITVVIALTLAIGIGANTSIFTLVDAVLLRKLPVHAPDELVSVGDPASVSSIMSSTNAHGELMTYEGYRTVRDSSPYASGMLASGEMGRVNVFTGPVTGEPAHPLGRFVSANYFSVLGVAPELGRGFDGSEDRTIGGAPVIVISHKYWQRAFKGDSAVVGREIHINDAAFTIVGVAPAGFDGEIVGQATSFWMPLTMQEVTFPTRRLLTNKKIYWLLGLARLRPGATIAQFEAHTVARLRHHFVETGVATEDVAAKVMVLVLPGGRGFSAVRDAYREPLVALTIGVALLLLIICANVANLLLARAVARAQEMKVRLAIGANRFRLVRQLLTESLLLACIGGAAGVAVAGAGSRLLLVLAADGSSPVPLDVAFDLRILAYSSGLSMLTVALFGLAPALRASRIDIASSLRAGGRSIAAGAFAGRGRGIPLGKILIGAQVSLSLVLLIGASLMVRSLRRIEHIDTGIDRDHLLVADIDVWARGYKGEKLTAFVNDMRARMAAIPAITKVTFSENGIFSGTESMSNLAVPGFAVRDANDTIARYDAAGPGYASGIGARIVAGREFTDRDDVRAPRVIMVNAAFARHYFGVTNPVGKTIRVSDSTNAEIVGVIADVHDHDLTNPVDRRYFVSYLQNPFDEVRSFRLLLRTTGDPVAAVAQVRAALKAIDPQLPVDAVDPLPSLMRESVAAERLLARLATAFGALALLLAAVGLYGVMTYAVATRTSEIGVRIALGAQRSEVVAMVLRDALRVVAAGALVGLPVALGLVRLLGGVLHGFATTDPLAISIALGLLATVAFFAAVIPALRAGSVAPLVALREE